MKRRSLSLRDIALVGTMTAVLEAGKIALTALPNIEVVTLLLILYTLYLPRQVPFVIPLFVVIEGLRYGFGLWWFAYLYVWPLLALAVRLCRFQKGVWFWSLFSAIYGLLFGALCAPVTWVVSGLPAAIGWWVAGIPFDLLHCGGNFLLCLLLFTPLSRAFSRLTAPQP